MKKKDLILIVSILLVAGALALIFLLFGRSGQVYVTANVDRKEIGRWTLTKDREIDLDTDYGHNHLSISGGKAKMTEADCPDGLCKYQDAVAGGGNLIICLPHHLVIEASGGTETTGTDTVAK